MAFSTAASVSHAPVQNTSSLRRACPPRRSRAAGHGARASADTDLVVVGAGVLGVRVAHAWRRLHADAAVVCATRTDARHGELSAAGFTPALAGELREPAGRVVFCAPPGRPAASEEGAYAAAVGAAGALARARFVFTSSTGVFADAPVVTERSPPADTPRVQRLLAAEAAAIAAPGGLVLRLAGLYMLERGPHAIWFRRGEVGGGPDGVLNLVHYDDAAEAVVRALAADPDNVVGERMLVADGAPTTRVGVLRDAHRHPMYAGFDMPTFGEGGAQKICDGSWTRERLGWEPRYKSFAAFMQEECNMVSSAA